jgi:hypothetical protein
MSITAMKLALEYLEASDNYLGSLDHSKPITALRTAIEQAGKQEPVAFIVNPDGEEQLSWCQPTYSKSTPLYTTPPAAIKQDLTPAPAAPVQELEKGCHRSHPHENMDAMCELRTEIARLTNENARLKAAAQQQWVGLTDEELELLNDCGDTDSYKFARAIEAKLREKNIGESK